MPVANSLESDNPQTTSRPLIERSAARYTCYAQRNGPTPPRLSIRLGSKAQPDVTAINRSATRYTCYAQRNGPGSGSSITCPLSLGASN